MKRDPVEIAGMGGSSAAWLYAGLFEERGLGKAAKGT